MRRRWLALVWFLAWLVSVANLRAADAFRQMDLTVGGVPRTALVYAPASARTNRTPVVFVFHGHGGSAGNAARSFALDRNWPEAISVYMQGLKTPGQLIDPGGDRAGWQAAAGDEGDRDLKFFDAVLARLKQEYQVATNRIYATGHSNGGSFTYLLWEQRAEVFAAVAPSSAAARYARRLKPKPALIIGGTNDPLVKFTWQEATMEAIRKVNGCGAIGERWGKDCTIYPSKSGTPVVTFIYPGGHELNPRAPELIAGFFKQYPARETK